MMLTDPEKKRIWDQWLIDQGLLVQDPILKGGFCVWTDRMLDLYAGFKDPEGEFTKADLLRIQAELWADAAAAANNG